MICQQRKDLEFFLPISGSRIYWFCLISVAYLLTFMPDTKKYMVKFTKAEYDPARTRVSLISRQHSIQDFFKKIGKFTNIFYGTVTLVLEIANGSIRDVTFI